MIFSRPRLLPAFLPLSLLAAPRTQAQDFNPVTGGAPEQATERRAELGRPAPDFELRGVDGREYRLRDQRGRIVVLQWTSHVCPAVNGYHDEKILPATQKAVEGEALWWSVDSSHFCEDEVEGIRKWRARRGLDHPYLLDARGAVGSMYRATTTPQVFVVDAQGSLAYAGGIDVAAEGAGSGERNWVIEAVNALAAGNDVEPASTPTRGCTVKYARPSSEPLAAPDSREWVCPPCGVDCHDRTYDRAGSCAICGMTLIVREGSGEVEGGAAQSVRRVAIVLWNGVELLDFSGPGEVFSSARSGGRRAFEVFTVAASEEPIVSQGFVSINPEYTIADCPEPDIIVLPGGGVRSPLANPAMMEWVERSAAEAEVVLSVCTGAFILARSGLLDGLEATTWHGAIDSLAAAAANTEVHRDRRFVDNGKIVTSAGVSAGIDASLHLVARLLGEDSARATARYMEYDWRPELFIAPAAREASRR